MKYHQTLLGMPPMTLNFLAAGVCIFLSAVGYRVARAPNLALRIASSQLITTTSASKLEALAQVLSEQAEIIQQKEKAYQQLESTYDEYIRSQKGDIDLGLAIEAIDDLPEVGNVAEIQAEIEETEKLLLESVTE